LEYYSSAPICVDEPSVTSLKAIKPTKASRGSTTRDHLPNVRHLQIPAQIQQKLPENMNGLIDKHFIYVNSLMILQGNAQFSDDTFPK